MCKTDKLIKSLHSHINGSLVDLNKIREYTQSIIPEDLNSFPKLKVARTCAVILTTITALEEGVPVNRFKVFLNEQVQQALELDLEELGYIHTDSWGGLTVIIPGMDYNDWSLTPAHLNRIKGDTL